MGQYLPILALLVLAVIFAAVSRVVSQLLAPRSPSLPKAAPYECGIVAEQGAAASGSRCKFFLVAMIFIVFDIEIIFLFPFATVVPELGGFGIAAIVIFSAAVFESFVYLISKGALDWGPVKQQRPLRRSCRRRAPPPPPSAGSASRAARAVDRGGSGLSVDETRAHGGLKDAGLEGLSHNFLTGTLEELVKWARKHSVMPATFGLACCAIEMMARRRRPLRPRPLRHGGLPGLPAPGRPHDRRRPRVARRWRRCCARSTTR